MAKKDSEGRWPTEDISLSEIETFAKTLLYLGRQYAVICGEIRKRGPGALKVGGKPTAEKGRDFLRGWLATLRSELDDLVIEEEPLELNGLKDIPSELGADIAKTAESLAAKKRGTKK